MNWHERPRTLLRHHCAAYGPEDRVQMVTELPERSVRPTGQPTILDPRRLSCTQELARIGWRGRETIVGGASPATFPTANVGRCVAAR